MLADLQLLTIQSFIDLDIDNDKEFSDILDLAASVCGTKSAFITILDDKNQYTKAGKGLGTTISKIEHSFCRHTVLQNDVMVVEDTLLDDRFKHYPAVSSPCQVKFYAGTPLVNFQGAKMGALCVTDKESLKFTDQQKTILKIISEKAINIMERRIGLGLLAKKEKQLEEQQKFIDNASIRLRSFFESSTNFQVLLGKDGDIIDFNKTAAQFVQNVLHTKMRRGDQFVAYVEQSFTNTFIDKYTLALTGKASVEEGSTDYGTHGTIWWDAAFEPAKDNDGNIIGVSYIIRNITERKEREQKIIKQNQSLLNIAHIQAHEFRAPLTTIMGIMGLIKEDITISKNEYFQFLDQAVNNLDIKIKDIVESIEDNIVSNIAIKI